VHISHAPAASTHCNKQDEEAYLADAKAWFEKAATQQHGAAMYALGTVCRRGEAGLKPSDAEGWFTKARAVGYNGSDDTFWYLLLRFCHKPS
jgi:TPR repeat protein